MAEILESIKNFLSSVEWSLVILYTLIAFLIAIIIYLIVTHVLAARRDKEFEIAMTYEASSIRIFRIDSPKNNVTYFNLGDMSNKRSRTLEEFYSSFPGHEPARIRNWVNDLLSGKDTTNYLQTTVYLKKSAKKIPSFLRVSKKSPEKGIVHLESYLLLEKKNTRSSTTPTMMLSSERDFIDYLKANGTNNGMTFCFALRVKQLEGVEDSKTNKLNRSFLLRYRLALEPFVKGTAKLLAGNESEFIVANYDMNDSTEAINYALKVVNSVTSALKANRKSHDPLFEIKVGIVANKDLLGDGTAIINNSKRCAANAFDSTSSLYFYHQGIDDFSETEIVTYRSEVERIIYEKKIMYTYRPIYCVSRQRVVGFLGRAEPTSDCAFDGIDELKNYAVRAKDEKNLFAAIAKNLLNTYVAERELKSQKLFYPASVSEIDNILLFFKRIRNAKDANLVFTFKEQDVLDSIDNLGLEKVLSLFQELHNEEYKISFILSGKVLRIDIQALAFGDAFLVDFSSHEDEKNMDATIRSQLHALVEKLIKYKKPIIASNLKNWNAIELIVGSGIDYVTADIFAPYSQMLQAVSDKHETRIFDMKGSYTIGKGK